MVFLYDIKRYSINDGPGVRVTLFFKGCPLSCKWCHNPESHAFKSEKLYNSSRCIGCSSCITACRAGALELTKTQGIITDTEKCMVCGKCAEICHTKAIEISGRDFTEEEIINTLLKEIHMMDFSGGGVTFSGGEPLMYPKVLKNLLVKCGIEGIHRAVDTSGYVKSSVVEEVLPYTDLFLYDLKLMDSVAHRVWTGVDNELILKNLRIIADHEKEYHIRIPLIEGVNADNGNLTATIAFLNTLKRKPTVVGILPYHNIASKKYEKLGRVYIQSGMTEPTKEKQIGVCSLFTENGFNALIGG